MPNLIKSTQMFFIRGSASSQHAYYMLWIHIDLLSDWVSSCNTHTHTHSNPSYITMTCWHRLAPFVTQQLTIIYSLTINHPSDSISTIYPFMVCNKGRASCRFSHIHVIIMSCWILRTLRCPWSEGPQAHNTPDCVPLATHMHINPFDIQIS